MFEIVNFLDWKNQKHVITRSIKRRLHSCIDETSKHSGKVVLRKKKLNYDR